MNSSYKLKKPTTYKEQINLLKSRNLIIRDEEKTIEILKKINYYKVLLEAYNNIDFKLLGFPKNWDTLLCSLNKAKIR